MPEIKRVFSASRMNRDLDDRLLQPGEYREALNINVSKSEGSDSGAIENLLGNKLVYDASGIANAKVIGQYRDTGNEKVFYYLTNNDQYDYSNPSNKKSQIIQYDQKAGKVTVLVNSNSLNFHKDFPITGINLVDNLLFWTDDRNPPRKINVETAINNPGHYNLAVDIDNLISVAKFAPYEAANILQLSDSDEEGNPITSNFLENKLIRFSYRWKFEDGEYSILAPFTPICFSRLGLPDAINTGTISEFGEIETFVNAVKSVQLSVPTPSGYGITGVELIYKESQSSVLYVVEDKSITTESLTTFFYKSQDPFKTLPGDQLTRIYDAVPRKAKSQELAGGRLIYGNFLQNFDIPDISFSVARTGETSARYTALDESMSVKSRRTYQVGIVLADKFGRQSPVILSSTGNDTVFIDAGLGESDSTNVFNALRVSFSQAAVETLQSLGWAYSYRIVVKQREQEYYNWISVVSGSNTVSRLGDSINKIPRDQTAVIPPSTSSTISPCDVSVYPKILSGANQTTASLTKVQSINNPSGSATVPTRTDAGATVTSGIVVYETEPFESDLDIFYETSTGGAISLLNTSGATIDVVFFNCYLLTFSSGTHIELNRLRAGFNEKFFDVGVRAYVVKENFAEERRFNTLIHSSGLFNSRTNINYINQFNEAEGGLTISLDPQDGSVQKLFADDTQIVIAQEDKISRSPINKDFIYSAEGGAIPVTSNTQFLGTIAPYAGEFGISKDPQSFAAFGYAKYFTDKSRGTVLRLSQNGLVEISNAGMSDFFRDALKTATEIIGSYDEYHGLYNLTIIGEGYQGNDDTNIATASDNYFTLSFDENSKGWSSFKSFKQEGGVSLNNMYYTFSGGSLWRHNDSSVTRNNFYNAGTAESYVEPILNDSPSLVKTFNNISYEGTEGWELDYLRTDLSDIGVVPTAADVFDITLQINRADAVVGANTIISGERIGRGKTGDVLEWAIFVSPKNSDYAFKDPSLPGNPSVTDQISITYSGSETVNITNPTEIVDGKFVFKVQYTIGSSNQTLSLDVNGSGAAVAFAVSLLTITISDTVTSAAVSPTLVELSTPGAQTQNVVIAPNTGYYMEPGLITAGISALSSLNTSAITGAETKIVKVVNYGGTNNYTIDGIRQNILSLVEGYTYTFDQSDSSNTGHPLMFSVNANGPDYGTGITVTGTPGNPGAATTIVVTAATPALYYYCTNHSGMGGAIGITPLPYVRTSNGTTEDVNGLQLLYSIPLTVPNTATNDVLSFSGSANALYNLTWTAPSSGVLTTPAGTSVGNAYTTHPFDTVATRTATLRWTASATDKTLLLTSHDATYNVADADLTEVLSSDGGYLETTIVLPKIYEDTVATATITGPGEETAALGTYPSTHTFAATSPTPLIIGDDAAEKANIKTRATPNQPWILINGVNGVGVADELGQYTFSAAENTTGSSRTGTITIDKNNSRVTGITAHVITITQSA